MIRFNNEQSVKDKLTAKYGEVESFEDLFEIVKSAANAKLGKKNKVVGLAWNVNYSPKVSCTHYAPVGKPTNWGVRQPELPKSYPGYSGRVWLRLQHGYSAPMSGGASSLLEQSFTHPGTGGSGSYSGPWSDIASASYKARNTISISTWSWDFRFFDEDYPSILQNHIKGNLLDIITTGEANIVLLSNLSWTDPETLENDNKFVKDFYA